MTTQKTKTTTSPDSPRKKKASRKSVKSIEPRERNQVLSPIAQIFDSGAQSFEKITDLDFASYVESTVMLDPDTEVTGGPYNLRDNPFWRQILNDLVDPEVYTISVIKSTRVGGTLALVAAILGLSQYSPSPAMVAAPDEISMKELRNRIYSTAQESPAYRDSVPPDRLWNMTEINLRRMKAYQAWSGSAQRLRGRTCRYVFRSETDVWAPKTSKGGDPMKASAERVGRFYYSKIYSESTPDGDPSQIDTLWESGNKSRWYCPCPHCNRYQEIRFFTHKSGKYTGKGGIVGWDDGHGGFASDDEVRRHSHYLCENGCKINTEEKYEFTTSGVWVPKGMRVKQTKEPTDNPKLIGKAESSRRNTSYHLWKAHIPSVSFGDIAAMYVDARKTATIKNFIQDTTGRKFSISAKLPGWRVLARRLSCEYPRGQVPEDCYFLTGGADVQGDGVYWIVWGWGDRGTMWLIDWGFIPRYESEESDGSDANAEDGDADDEVGGEYTKDISGDLYRLGAVIINRSFPVVGPVTTHSPLGEKHLQCRIVNIDTNYRTREVQEFVRHCEPNPTQSCRHDRVRTCRGHHAPMKERFKMSNVEKPQAGGDDYKGGMQLWSINKNAANEEMFQRMLQSVDTIGAMRFYKGIEKDGEECVKQLCNERPAFKVDTQTGRKKRFWKVQNESIGNHLWDGSGYARAGADMELHRLKLSWDSSTWDLKDHYTSSDDEYEYQDHDDEFYQDSEDAR